MFSTLKSAGVHDVYRRTIQVIRRHGLSNVLTYDPYSGSVDLYGAMLLACGAHIRLLEDGCDNPPSCGVPDTMLRELVLAVEYFEASAQQDISEWHHGFGTTVHTLRFLADRIEMSVTPTNTFRS